MFKRDSGAGCRMRHWLLALLLVGGVALFAGCSDDDDKGTEPEIPTDPRVEFDLQTLPAIPYPPDNLPRQERISLGKLLFFDPILGGEKDASCATCHHPDFAFADRRQLAAGVSGTGLGPHRILSVSAISGEPIGDVPRNSPTCFNTAFNLTEDGEMSHQGLQFWDGRVNSLEEQAVKPITSRVEMRGDAYPGTDPEASDAAIDSVLARLVAIPEYIERFRSAFPEDAAEVDAGTRETVIDSVNYGRAIAAYERELVTRYSPYDRYVMGDDDALSDTQLHGLRLFFTKAKCAECHNGPMFTNFKFVVHGTPQLGPGKDVIPGDDCGREEHTHLVADRYKFRVPSLRNVELTPPYTHDGHAGSLQEVLLYHNAGAQPRHPEVTDEMLHEALRDPLGLTDAEMFAIVEFLKALTDPGIGLDPFLLTVPDRVPSGLTPVTGLGDPGSGLR